jgi:hypothetical protein
MVVGLSIGGLVSGTVDGRAGGRRWRLERVDKEGVVGETGISLTALGVEDPEGRPTPRRTVAVVRDERFGSLSDDVAAQADPRPASQLEPDTGRLGDRGREATGRRATAGRIEDQQQGLRATGERGESTESVGDPARLVGAGQSTAGQVEDEEVDRTPGQEAAGDAQALVEAGRGDDDEPLEADTAGDGLDRVEAARQVEPGDDRALRLRLRGDAKAEGRAAARALATDGDAGRLRKAAGPQDRVERGEAGSDDAVVGARVIGRRGVGRIDGDEGRCRWGREGQRADDPRSCRTPPGPEARDSGIHITPTGRHWMPRIEQMF